MLSNTPTALFGATVAMSADGSTALIGQHDALVGQCVSAGQAHIVTRAATGWQTRACLEARQPDFDGHFGITLALSHFGTVACIGAENDAAARHFDTGSVTFFQKIEHTWRETQRILSPLDQPTDRFGAAVAYSANGQWCLISADGANQQPHGDGAVFVYRFYARHWHYLGLLPSPPVFYAGSFGQTIALSADGAIALVTAYSHHTAETDTQSIVWVYRRIKTQWTVVTYLSPPAAHKSYAFGSTLALSADGVTAAVTATRFCPIQRRTTNWVYVFRRKHATWQPVACLHRESTSPLALFGRALAFTENGACLAVGDVTAIADEAPPWQRVVCCQRTAAIWVPQTLRAPTEHTDHQFGAALAFDANGRTLVIGAPARSGTTATGRVYVVDRGI